MLVTLATGQLDGIEVGEPFGNTEISFPFVIIDSGVGAADSAQGHSGQEPVIGRWKSLGARSVAAWRRSIASVIVESAPRRASPPPNRTKLGTFLGVYTPSTLTILGVILYLRSGWVVGNVGLGGAIVIVVIANGVTLTTALSISAIATNMRVGAGGAYYMISRSLGVEIGAAIGIPLF